MTRGRGAFEFNLSPADRPIAEWVVQIPYETAAYRVHPAAVLQAWQDPLRRFHDIVRATSTEMRQGGVLYRELLPRGSPPD